MQGEQQIDRLARRQHGLVTRVQALALGAPRSGIAWKLDRGRWLPLHPGVYAVAGAPATWHQAVLAACLAGGPAALASHGTALALWELSERPTDAVHLLTPPSRRIRLEGVIAHRTTLLSPSDISRVASIPCTSPARAIVEASGALGPSATGRLLDRAIRREPQALEGTRACVARLAGPGRRRLSVIRAVLAERLPGYDPGDSDLEVRALRALHRAGLPAPVQQHAVAVGDRRYRIDLAYPDRRVAIELDGWWAHGVRSAFDADRMRGNDLVVLGWRLVRFTSTTAEADLVATVGALLDAPAA